MFNSERAEHCTAKQKPLKWMIWLVCFSFPRAAVKTHMDEHRNTVWLVFKALKPHFVADPLDLNDITSSASVSYSHFTCIHLAVL